MSLISHSEYDYSIQTIVCQRNIRNMINLKLVQTQVVPKLNYNSPFTIPDFPISTNFQIRYSYKGVVTTKEKIDELLKQEIKDNKKETENLMSRVQKLEDTSIQQLIDQLTLELQVYEELKKQQFQQYKGFKDMFNDQVKQINREMRQLREEIAGMGNLNKRKKVIDQWQKSLDMRYRSYLKEQEKLKVYNQQIQQKKDELLLLQKEYQQSESEYEHLNEKQLKQIDDFQKYKDDLDQSGKMYDYQNQRLESCLQDPVKLNIQNIKTNVKNNRKVMESLKKLGQLYKMPHKLNQQNERLTSRYRIYK